MTSTAQPGTKVALNYIGTLDDGRVFDSTEDRGGPIEVTLGESQVLPAFEEAIIGMGVGEDKTVSLTSEEAYGERDEDAVQVVPNAAFDAGMELEPGMYIVGKNDSGEFPARVVSIAANGVTIDMNHPLAGEALKFEVSIVSIEEATP